MQPKEKQMAKIQETIFVIKLSQLVRDRGGDGNTFADLPATIEQVIQELVPGDVVVEVEQA
jgi:hypothetical protein